MPFSFILFNLCHGARRSRLHCFICISSDDTHFPPCMYAVVCTLILLISNKFLESHQEGATLPPIVQCMAKIYKFKFIQKVDVSKSTNGSLSLGPKHESM